MSDKEWIQDTHQISKGGLGIQRITDIALLLFLHQFMAVGILSITLLMLRANRLLLKHGKRWIKIFFNYTKYPKELRFN